MGPKPGECIYYSMLQTPVLVQAPGCGYFGLVPGAGFQYIYDACWHPVGNKFKKSLVLCAALAVLRV